MFGPPWHDRIILPWERTRPRTAGDPTAASRPRVDILWITAGLGCDGDTIAITAATQPSIEDLLLGAIPGMPKVHLHNPVLAYENGDDFLQAFHQAAEGKLDPFILVVEGSIPEREEQGRGLLGGAWARTRRPASRSRPATGSTGWRPKAWAVVAAGTCAAYGGIHAMAGNPTGCMGLPDYLGWDWKSKAGHPDRLRARLPGAAGQLHGNAALPAVPGGGPWRR